MPDTHYLGIFYLFIFFFFLKLSIRKSLFENTNCCFKSSAYVKITQDTACWLISFRGVARWIFEL